MRKRKTAVDKLLDGSKTLELAREVTIQRLIAAGMFDTKTGKTTLHPDLGLDNKSLETAYKKFKRKSKDWQKLVVRLATPASKREPVRCFQGYQGPWASFW